MYPTDPPPDNCIDNTNATIDTQVNVGVNTGTIHLGPRPIDIIPPPPDSAWVERPPFQEIKAALLRKSEGQRACIVTAVQGMGGIGKTWLARALANDADIQKEMGVFWVNVGQETVGSETIMRDLTTLLAPSHPRAETRNGTEALLRGLLAERPHLLVLDDVWTEEIAIDFGKLLTKDTPSRLLITTRKSWMAENLGATAFPLNLMNEAESVTLFENHLGRPLQPQEMYSARQLAGLVKYLPLALSLVIARIKRGQAWDNLRETLQKHIGTLNETTTRRPGQKIEPTLEAVFNTSLNPLRDSPQWRSHWEGFIRLSVLAEDTRIAPPLARRLLGDTGPEILELLADEGLLMRVQSDGRLYQLHDLLQDHARQLLERPLPEGLGTPLAEAETQLLTRYGLDCKQSETFGYAWQLTEDGYIHNRLVYHLARLRWMDCMEVVLTAETSDSRNGWFQARERLGQTSGFIADVEQWKTLLRARSLAQMQNESVPDCLGKEVRCGLLLSTIRSLAANLPPILLANLIRFDSWKLEQCLAYLLQISDERKRVGALAAIAPHLPADLSIQVLKMAEGIKDVGLRSDALIAIAPQLPEDVSIQALKIAEGIKTGWRRAKALAAIAPQLPAELALKIVEELEDEGLQAKALAAIAPHLPEDLSIQALKIAKGIWDKRMRADVLVAIAPHLPAGLADSTLQQALKIAEGIGDLWDRAKALAAIAPQLPAELALKIVEELENESLRAKALVAIAPHLSQDLSIQALKIVAGIQDWRIGPLSNL